jgi:hypothetical protein
MLEVMIRRNPWMMQKQQKQQAMETNETETM